MTKSLLPSSNSRLIWRCALPAPLRRLFDYLPPINWKGSPKSGLRVRVPFGRRTLIGILVSIESESLIAESKLRRIEEVLDTVPLLSDSTLTLLKWTANYYQHPLGEVLPLGLSPGERRGRHPRSSAIKTMRLTKSGRGLPENAIAHALKQSALIAKLRDGPVSLKDLAKEGFQRRVLQALIDKGFAEEYDFKTSNSHNTREELNANPDQMRAVEAIRNQFGSFSVHLLYGITGSGKTEVYLQCIANCLDRGQQALVLLPEISLTPQNLAQFQARFDAPIVILHSAMGDAERDRCWNSVRQGESRIILGTRSAVFVPMALHKLGIIVVDEEHDIAFVQQDGLRYSARDVAIKRGQLEHCPVVLGTATPSLESWHNAERGRYHEHRLEERAGSSTLPSQSIIDVRGLDLIAGLSPHLIIALEKTLALGNQALVFLNRRGFANALMCHDCGWNSKCNRCDVRMTLHKRPPELRCHHCDHRQPVPRQCPDCNSHRLVATGVGTQQTESFLAEKFSDLPVVRVDSDTMANRSSMSDLISRLDSANPVVLIGTQMLSKGHHFPHVTLVAIVDADSLLFSPDFRGEERLLQLLTQVSGRAGRDQKSGEVLIQTRYPEHPLISRLDQPYHSHLRELLCHRRQSNLPPIGALGILRCDSADMQQGLNFLACVRGKISLLGVRFIGPLPAAMARRKGLYRSQLIVSASCRKRLAEAMTVLINRAESHRASSSLAWSIDIDPYESL